MFIIARQSFNTQIESTIQTTFKEKCKENGLKMNQVLEIIMQAYINDKFSISTKVSYDFEIQDNKKDF